MRRFGWIVLVTALLAAFLAPGLAGQTLAAPAARPHTAAVAASPAHFFDKTRFVLHAGAAYFAFHHWVWKPYKAHAFDKGKNGRIKAMFKAGIALLFTVHELKVAYGIAKGSHSAILHAIIAPVNALISAFGKVGNQLKHGVLDTKGINGLNSLTNSVSSKVGGIRDIPLPIPGI